MPQRGKASDSVNSNQSIDCTDQTRANSAEIPSEARELQQLLHLAEDLGPLARLFTLGRVESPKRAYPLLALSLGCQAPQAPTLAVFAGVHGLERIGCQVALSFLQNLAEGSRWDEGLQETLKRIRITVFPVINPAGVFEKRRANPRGVDLMRNSPVIAELEHWPLSGQRLSPRLPWYSGNPAEPELETQAVYQFAEEVIMGSEAVISLDLHSGFGLQDRIWFPFSYTKRPFSHLAETHRLFSQFERNHPHHFYKIEPSSQAYPIGGDLWDHLYLEYTQRKPKGIYLPLTLEMGSWMWVKKNPLQILRPLGLFHPIKPHREKRILRRHHTLFDFLIKALRSHRFWTGLNPGTMAKHQELGLERWHGSS